MQPSSGGCFSSIQFFSTEAAAFLMPIFFFDYCEYMWYPCAFVQYKICTFKVMKPQGLKVWWELVRAAKRAEPEQARRPVT
jgi:hypothetical protein